MNAFIKAPVLYRFFVLITVPAMLSLAGCAGLDFSKKEKAQPVYIAPAESTDTVSVAKVPSSRTTETEDDMTAHTTSSEYAETKMEAEEIDRAVLDPQPAAPETADVETPVFVPPGAEPLESSSYPAHDYQIRKAPRPKTATTQRDTQTTLDEALDYCQVSQDFWQKGELESALEALDQAYELLLQVETDDNPKIIQQKEDIRFTISKRILEIYASRNTVVKGQHNAIPMDINKYVQKEIDLFTKGREKDFFIRSYKRSGRYRPMITEALKAAGLPVELSWLPLIESGYKVNALSRARALGLWQFIPSTGYKFGLKRNLHVDERMDPVKATQAAIAYLKELHQIFGDWATVLAAYNCGEGRVLRVIRSQNVNYLDNFWDLFERLPYETARYVPRFLATLRIVSHKEEYGLNDIVPDAPIEWETVTLERQVQLKDIAKAMEFSTDTLKELNPELRYDLLPPEKYELKVPPESGEILLAAVEDLPVYSRPQQSMVYHRVRHGETLSTIARRYGTSVQNICLLNNIRKRHLIITGTRLKIPQRGYKIAAASGGGSSAVDRIVDYTVKSGDSLWILAKRYGTTVREIQDLNHISGTNLNIDQKLKMPAGNASGDDSTTKTYRVKRGDTPFKIAQMHHMSLGRFLRINRLTPRSKIYPGQRLNVE